MRKSLVQSILALGLLSISFGACGGGAAIGAACTKQNDPSECESGALCARTASAALECQQLCVAQTDCPANFNCNGATLTQKVCQPK